MAKNKVKILNNVKKIHFIGIGGIGMSGIAEYLVRKGFTVTGSDLVLSEITKKISDKGVEIFEGHNENNLNPDTDLVVYTSAVKEDNTEFVKAKKLGIPAVKRAAILGEIVNDKILIAISGTHGKTSTTAMLAKIFIDCNLDPTVFLGGTIDFLEDGNSRIGEGKYAVVEADEYDRSFLTLRPDYIVVTNIDLDHTDIYSSLDDLKKTFVKFISGSKECVKVIGYGDDRNVLDVFCTLKNKNCYTYGFGGHNNFIIDESYKAGENMIFELNNHKIEISVPGRHNILNASATFILSEWLEIDRDCLARNLKSFFGVNRRLELKYNKGIKVYDDYAHHPTEVEYSFNAVKEVAKSRVITVFQPHTYTRTRDFYEAFAYALKGNDITILTDVYPAREKKIEGVGSELIYDKLLFIDENKVYLKNSFDEVINLLDEVIEKGDTVIFQGAGNITDLCSTYVKKLNAGRN
jgi:UDP-N-acetylmuramate--alanine ligase